MNLTEVKNSRMNLLKLEDEHDKNISKCPCKEQVIKHLLLLRDINRGQTTEICHTGLMNYKKEYMKHILFFTKQYEGSENICDKICL